MRHASLLGELFGSGRSSANRALALLMLCGALHAPARAGDLAAQSVAAGKFHFCAIVGGGAQCWGDNFDGQLGDGTFRDATSPVAVHGLQSGVTAIAGGGFHTCALVNGGVKCWGFNGDGELGDGTVNSSGVPVSVQGLGSGVIAIAAGEYHTCAVLSGGAVRCWGWNGDGQLGNNTTTATNASAPVSVLGITSGATAATAGNAHTCAIVAGGVKCWGNNAWGQLDDGSTLPRHTAVTALALSGVVAISAGIEHTCAILGGGSVSCWGRNSHGQLGNNSVAPTGTNAPVQPSGISANVTSIASGGDFTCATVAGAAKCWGSNLYGELGDGTLTERHVPATVNGLASGVGAIAAADFSVCAQTAAQQTKCWGDNIDGEVGQGAADVIVRTVPAAQATIASGATALGRGGHGDHSCAIVAGAARCWGDNDFGELGDGTVVPRSTPITVQGLASGVAAIAIGSLHTCAVVGGAAKCWGNNDHGQLGIGSSGGLSTTPVTPVASGVTAVAAGVWHTCAIVGTVVKCWGYNNDGQLGNGSTSQSNSPVTVNGLAATPVALAAGAWHTCALLSTGAIQCWGYNSNGQLGNNSNVATKTNPPVSVSNIAGATAISAGAYHSCAIAGGGARCWGYGQDGELGDGGESDSYVPVAVTGLATGVSAIAAGSWHTCAIANGAASCWGYNNSGQNGNGSYDNRTAPTAVSGLALNVSAISGGDTHACAIVDGAVRCWGGDYWGQLGTGRAVYYATPQTAVASTSPDAPCGSTLVGVGAIPSTQAQGQPVLFSVSIGNVVSPGGTIAVYSDNALVCGAATSGDPQASCWGFLALGTHAVTAVWSGDGTAPSGCSSPLDVTISSDAGLSDASLVLSVIANDAVGLQQGASASMKAEPKKPQPPAGSTNGLSSASAGTFSGYVTFYDGATEIGSVPIVNDVATYTNRFDGGTHHFSAAYSGDAGNTSGIGTNSVQFTLPADDIHYGGFELPPG